jgi:hypothetical protein
MKLRIAFALVALSPAVPAAAGEYLRPEQAHQFVAGKYFTYNCFDGTAGAGRIQADGSVAGTIRMRGAGAPRYVALPAGTIRVKPNSICAALRGMPMEPCFNVEQIDANSFRGSVSGFGFAYCTFTRRNPRLQVAQSADPVSLMSGSIRRSRHVKSAEATVDASAPTVSKVPVESVSRAPLEPAGGELKLRPSASE